MRLMVLLRNVFYSAFLAGVILCGGITHAIAADNTDLVFQLSDDHAPWVLRYIVKPAVGDKEPQLIGAVIVDQSSNKILQKLDFEKSFSVDFNPDTYLSENIITDLNFDNLQDLAIPIHIAAGGNVDYAVWLFDSASQKYVFNPILSKLVNLDVNSGKKQILSSEKCCGGTAGVDQTFQWQEGKLFLIQEMKYERMNPQPDLPASPECKNAVWMVDTTRIWNGSAYDEKKSDPYAMCE